MLLMADGQLRLQLVATRAASSVKVRLDNSKNVSISLRGTQRGREHVLVRSRVCSTCYYMWMKTGDKNKVEVED